jgi:hypothetical protein
MLGNSCTDQTKIINCDASAAHIGQHWLFIDNRQASIPVDCRLEIGIQRYLIG